MLELILHNRQCPPDRGVRLYENYGRAPVLLPYRDLPGHAARAAQHLREQGVRAGTRVVLPFETTPEAIFTFLGLLEAGAVPLSVKPLIPGTAPAGYQAFLQRIARDFRAEYVVRTSGLGAEPLPAAELAPAPADEPIADAGLRAPEDAELAFVQFSSGSTGFPKAVPITYRALRANLAAIAGTDRRGAGEKVSSWLPLYHDMGLVGGLLSCCAEQSDALISTPLAFLADPLGWWRHLSADRVQGTVIPNFAIDYSLRMLENLDAAVFEELDLSGLRRIYLGSEPINLPNLMDFLDLMAPAGLDRNVFMPCYGMTETVLMVSSRPPGAPLLLLDTPAQVAAVSVGAPLQGFTVRIRADDGTVCADGQVGEIELSGGSLATTLFDDPEPLAGPDGFFRTGDAGFLSEGELFVTGRVGDRLDADGRTFFASDFEQAAERLPFVREGRTAAIQSGGRIVLLAEVDKEAREDIPGSRALVVAHFAQTLGVSVDAADVHYLKPGQLERTSSGKLKRRAIARAYEEGALVGLTLDAGPAA